MRVSTKPVDAFMQLLWECRPCPSCASERVTVRLEGSDQGEMIVAVCSDCGFRKAKPQDKSS